MPDIWYTSEPEVMARMAHYKYKEEAFTRHADFRASPERVAYARDRVFAAAPHGGDLRLVIPDDATPPDRFLSATQGRSTWMREHGLNPDGRSWNVDSRYLTLVCEATHG